MFQPDPDLFDVRRRKKRAPAPPVPNGAVQHLLGRYVAYYTTKFGEPPVITKKDGAILKRLVLAYGEETVAERMKLYLRWQDPFVVKSAWSIGVLHVKWNEVTLLAKPHAGPRSTPDVAATQHYLRALRAGKKR